MSESEALTRARWRVAMGAVSDGALASIVTASLMS
jgi:hypothetical protein